MANLDTAAKRYAGLMNTGGLVFSSGLVMPDGVIDAADRQTLAGMYLPDDAPTPPSGGNAPINQVSIGIGIGISL